MANHQVFRASAPILAELIRMFDELPEGEQILDASSARPRVVHRSMGQLTLVTDGEGTGQFDGDLVELRPGVLVVLGAGCTHAFATGTRLTLRHFHWPQSELNTDRHILQEVADGLEAAPPHQ